MSRASASSTSSRSPRRTTGPCSTRARPSGRPSAPPRGTLFQEHLRGDPFWMMVACCLVNLTTWEQAEPAFLNLRRRFVHAGGLAGARPARLVHALRPLGLSNIRSKRLVAMAKAWCTQVPSSASDVLSLPGCGSYAADSWAIFIEGRLLDRDTVSDHKLGWFLDAVASGKKETPMPCLPQGSSSTEN